MGSVDILSMLVNHHIDCNRGRIESILYIHTFIANDDDEGILELDDDDIDIHNNSDLASKYYHYSNHDISMRFI